mmetsp:Transcript_10205/g.62255  ORF Transcript_10205/g.62255 Transcript_10205/m.62255 type:complete len:329 (-) Transcript_10205:749-1735(-)
MRFVGNVRIEHLLQLLLSFFCRCQLPGEVPVFMGSLPFFHLLSDFFFDGGGIHGSFFSQDPHEVANFDFWFGRFEQSLRNQRLFFFFPGLSSLCSELLHFFLGQLEWLWRWWWSFCWWFDGHGMFHIDADFLLHEVALVFVHVLVGPVHQERCVPPFHVWRAWIFFLFPWFGTELVVSHLSPTHFFGHFFSIFGFQPFVVRLSLELPGFYERQFRPWFPFPAALGVSFQARVFQLRNFASFHHVRFLLLGRRRLLRDVFLQHDLLRIFGLDALQARLDLRLQRLGFRRLVVHRRRIRDGRVPTPALPSALRRHRRWLAFEAHALAPDR